MTAQTKCTSCGEEVALYIREVHWTEGTGKDGFGHKGLCCDCFDLKWMPLESVNRSREKRGLAPLPASLEKKA